jgi:transmembrane sensor
LLIFFLLDTNPPSAMKYATGVGQSRAVTLSDGSKIEMNTATTLSVQVSSRQRRVTLDRGEAVFRIRHERGRPFIVRAGDREVHDIGTVFDVLRNGEVIAIAVAEGQIAVAPAAGGEPITMRAGQRLRHTEGSSSSTLDTVDPQWVTTWQNGYLIYRDAPLRDVVADLNRYFRRPITLDERAASAEHFSGVLRIHDENTAVTQLTAFLPIIAIRQADGTIQLRSSKPKH